MSDIGFRSPVLLYLPGIVAAEMQEPPEGLAVTPCHNFCQEWRIYCIYLCCCSSASSDFGNP